MRRSLYDYCVENNRIELLDQWDEAANLPQTPQTISYGSKYKAHWHCENGHKWQAQVWSRTGNRSGCPVCAGLVIIPGENDLATLFPEIAAQWHEAKNMGVTPADVGAYTHRKAWWRCRTCGHEWLAEIKSRTSGTGCPVCTGKTVVSGVNDLASQYPKIASEWHPTKNGALTPQTVTTGTMRKAWWICGKCGHEWQASIASRTRGSGCPVCAGKTVVPGVNDLKSRFPDIAEEWHPTKNGNLTPDAVTAQSNRKVWWKCEKGHSYQAMIASRTSDRHGCPYCANRKVLLGFNDLASQLPTVAREWHPVLNGALTPEDVTCGSAKRVWWKCNVCGWEWKAIIHSRAAAQRCGCPMCAGRIRQRNRTRYQRIMDEASVASFALNNTGTDPP